MTVVVTAAVIEQDGRFLVTRRPKGVHLEGLWEFPGGKCDEGESLGACLRRELVEELGAEAVIGAEIFSITHEYSERTVALHFFTCALTGEPRPLLGQEMRWVARSELRSLRFPPADDELVALLEGQTGG
ncbi:MAG TPA: (deoxy)nucleoside triphosphate pyrophosphohydrolase [Vicinamibacterales bacterium]